MVEFEKVAVLDFKYSLNFKSFISQILHTDNYMKNKRDFRVFEIN